MTQDAETIEAVAQWLEESLTPEEIEAMLKALKKMNGAESLTANSTTTKTP